MKKTYIFIILASTFFANQSALAKTEGSYLGIDVSSSKARHRYTGQGSISTTPIYAQNAQGTNFGYGINYKYAFNKDNVFLAPELFYDNLNSSVNDNDHNTINLDYRYGAKLNLGYDVTDYAAVYATGGLANQHYLVRGRQRSPETKYAQLWGAGVAFYPHKNIALNFEYNVSDLKLSVRNSDLSDHTRSKVEVYKVGIAYKF